MFDLNLITVEEVVPHAPPMVLLDRIVHYEGMVLVAEVTITPDSMFYRSELGGVPSWVGIEYMAQAISALSGLRAKERNQSVKLGFLLGTRKLLLPRNLLKCGALCQIHVKQLLWDDSGLANFECRILCGDEVCVEARVNVYQTAETKMPGAASNG